MKGTRFKFIGGPWDSAIVPWPADDLERTINGRWIGVQLVDVESCPAAAKLSAEGSFTVMHTNDEDGTFDFNDEKKKAAISRLAKTLGDDGAREFVNDSTKRRTAVYTMTKVTTTPPAWDDHVIWTFRQTFNGIPSEGDVAHLLEGK